MDGGNDIWSGPRLIEDGEWAGWRTWNGMDPFEDQSGPFYFREDAEGRVTAAFRAEKKHMNGGGFMHGGCMMTFADYALFVFARDCLREQRAVTASFTSDFIGAVSPGMLLEATGEVVRDGRSLVFVRGQLETGGEPIMTFQAVLKKVGRRA